MYKIAICDDEKFFLDFLFPMCEDILTELDTGFSIDAYSSCDLLFCALAESKNYDLLLLDIMMDGMNGMELAKKIRGKGINAAIVFITSTREYVLQGYDVRAFHYLLKPVSKPVLKKVIQRHYRNYLESMQRNFITFKEGTGFQRLDANHILYLETTGRKVTVHLKNKKILASNKLMDLACKLPPDQFVRCHQSFIVNVEQIVELHYGEAIMKDTRRIPISRPYLSEMKKFFLSALGKGNA